MVQENLDKQYEKNPTFFFDRIAGLLNEGLTDGKFQSAFENLSLKLDDDDKFSVEKELSLNQFLYIGSISYLVGLDFSSQEYLNEDVMTRVKERLNKVFGTNLNEYFSTMFCNTIVGLTEDNIRKSKDKFVNKIEAHLKFDNATYQSKFYQLFSIAKSIILNGSLPVNICEETNKLLKTNPKEISGLTILKLNSIIHESLKFEGKLISKYIQLHSSDIWSVELQKAAYLFDNKKFGIIYFDSIMTLKENISRLNKTDMKDYDWLNKILFGTETIDYSLYVPTKDDIKDEVETEIVETEVEGYKNRYDNIELQRVLVEDPDEAAMEIFRDIRKKDDDCLSFEDMCASVDFLINDLDYSSQLYQFFEATLKSDKRNYKYNTVEFSDWLKNKYKELSEIYTENVKFSCSEIEPELLKQIIKSVDEIIDYVVLNSSDTKQYLISQKLDNSISTYNHLLEIITLIESCEITGYGIEKYVELYNLLNADEKTKKAFELIEATEKATQQMKVLDSIKSWFAVEETKEDSVSS